MKIPELTNPLVEKIDQALEAKAEKPRPHMGCSQLGHSCDLWLWLNFRWAVQEKFPGRILRLFARGHKEEESVVEYLEMAGVQVRKHGEKQTTVNFGSHVSGSVDGIIMGGVPGAESTMHVLEIKTHALKSFLDLKKKGVEESKPMHFTQMQLYMKGTGIDRALYYAVCKNDDSVYTERIVYQPEVAKKYQGRGQWIALAQKAPPPMTTRADWFECKWCAAYDFCHQGGSIEEKNCRTCKHSEPLENSTWVCGKQPLHYEEQLKGCVDWELHPDLEVGR